MGIARKSLKPVAITNESGQPEIVLEIAGLTLSMTPPARDPGEVTPEGTDTVRSSGTSARDEAAEAADDADG